MFKGECDWMEKDSGSWKKHWDIRKGFYLARIGQWEYL